MRATGLQIRRQGARRGPRQAGFSLVEMMIAMTIGLVLLTGLSVIFVNSSRSSSELQASAQQIENGRYALQTMGTDLRHAGFYGVFSKLPVAPAAADPCILTTTGSYAALRWHVQGIAAADLSTRPDLTGTTCGTWLTNANLSPGSDIVIVRRAETSVFTGTPVAGRMYLQANTVSGDVYQGSASASVPTQNPSSGTVEYTKKDGTTPADTRRYLVHVYFVAPCSIGSGTNGVCTSSDGSVPTLKRLVLDASGGSTTMTIDPLVEGIEYMRADYGIDNAPASTDPSTGSTGDGVADTYSATPAAGDWPGVVAVRLHLLVRNTTKTAGFVDSKSYTLGGTSVSAPGDNYKRHVFSSEIRINNGAGRREIPSAT